MPIGFAARSIFRNCAPVVPTPAARAAENAHPRYDECCDQTFHHCSSLTMLLSAVTISG